LFLIALYIYIYTGCST